jgi:asparagine synthase (glutamine-hydrolysing)
MNIGFAVLADAAGASVGLYGAPAPGRLPLIAVADEGGVRCVLMGRLYYRADLVARLAAAPAERDNPAALALALYRQSGAAGLEALEGDFALALHDSGARRLVAMADPMGGYPLFWIRRAGGGVGVATGLRPLVDELPRPSIDVGFLGEVQVLPFAEPVHQTRTAFEGAARLRPGTMLAADLAIGRVDIRPWWDWAERAIDPGTDDIGEIGRRYRALLDAAVAERMVGTVAAQVSGGMDSTAVGFLAADRAAARGERVHALSLVYDALPGLDIEKPYVDLALDRPGLVPHRLVGDAVLDFDVFATVAPHDEPFAGLFRIGLDRAMTDAAVAAGAETMMTGLGADELLATAPYHIADMVRAGRFRAAWREAAGWSREYNTSVWKWLRPFGLKPLLPVWLMPGIGPLLRGGYASWSRQNQSTIAPATLKSFAKTGKLRARALEILRLSWKGQPSVVMSEAVARLVFTAGGWAGHAVAAPAGVHETHPFRDPRVLAFALGARRRFHPPPSRRQKPILAAALRGTLPDPILDRRAKGNFNALYYRGLSRNLPALEALVRDSKCDAMGLFDKAELVACMRDMAVGVRGLDGMVGLNSALAVIKWLSLLPRWLATKPVPARLLGEAPAKGSA